MAYKIRQTAEAVSTGGSLISDAKLKQLYTIMLQCRLLTERARRAHNRNGSAGLYAASVGQEAIATGCAIDLRAEDAIASHESIASRIIAGLVKGVPLNATVAELYADHVSPIPSTHRHRSTTQRRDQLGLSQQARKKYRRCGRFYRQGSHRTRRMA